MGEVHDSSVEPLAYRELGSEGTSARRLVSRSSGRSLARYVNLWPKYPRFILDHFTTVVNARWYIIFAVVASCFVCSWIIFAVLWLIIDKVDGTCIISGNDKVLGSFSTALLFAVETQVTIGYGELFINSHCTAGVLLLLLQCLFAYFMEALLLGLVFTKLARPRQRAKTILFSKNFIVSRDKRGVRSIQHDDQITTVRIIKFRIADIRRSQLVEAHVRLYLYWNKCCHGDDSREFQQFELDVGYVIGRDRVFLLLPMEVSHVMQQDSPLHDWSERTFMEEDYELVVVLEGIVEATGMTSQVVWSYTSSDALFNRQFSPMVQRCKGVWQVDFSKLNNTESVQD